MNVIQIIRSLSVKQLIKLVGFIITRPVFFYAFLKATKQTIKMAIEKFGKSHHKNNEANAYRHALWNMLILYHCMKYKKSIEQGLTWAETITNWHEEAFKNNSLEKAMDLHNNKTGRTWFEEMYKKTPSLSISAINHRLIHELLYSKKVSSIKEIQNICNALVYIN